MAARAVALQEHIPAAVRRTILAELGLLDEATGELIEPDWISKTAPTADVSRMNGPTNRRHVMGDETRIGRDRWKAAVPEGLRNYDPREHEQKALRNPPKSRPLRSADSVEHGSLSGRSFHTKRGEPLCDPCRAFYNNYQAEGRKKRSTARKGQAA